ncbi:hypothetical protein [Cecembia lonarensis]|uniref:Uncharacterized protein n=1 Tax=Cecembia lonarensis (strain CCUG 58316 / KCTC 22772 / LW9) TaxID=1225176 RepID=K1LEC4_CECL9|nr:hypothetical protein [Cecembia lonarensis]EKB48698.1 hypothetical protein B879_02657 [Cecembia lonarensis LW9]
MKTAGKAIFIEQKFKERPICLLTFSAQIMNRKRCVIYPKDIQRMTDKSERYSQDLLHKIRIYFNKQSHQFITVKEFSEFSGIPRDEIESYL